MTTRRKFTGGLLASGMLANFALVAAPKDTSCNIFVSIGFIDDNP